MTVFLIIIIAIVIKWYLLLLQVYVWHTHTSHPSFDNERSMPSNPRVQLKR